MKTTILSFAACLSLATALVPTEPALRSAATGAPAPDCTYRPTQTVTALEGCPTNCATVDQCFADSELPYTLPAPLESMRSLLLLLVTRSWGSCRLTQHPPSVQVPSSSRADATGWKWSRRRRRCARRRRPACSAQQGGASRCRRRRTAHCSRPTRRRLLDSIGRKGKLFGK